MNKLVPYEYFMDEMQDYEIQTLSGMLDYVDYNDWRRMRLLYHGILAPHMKRQTTPEKLLPFPWDDDMEEHITEMTNKERDTMRERSKQLAQKMFKKDSNTVNG